MTKLQEIRSLQKQLPCRDYIIAEHYYSFVNDEYTAHHCNSAVLSETIGDWQVFRKFDIEIEVNMDWEYEKFESMSKKEKKKFMDSTGELDIDKLYEEYEPYENMYQFEHGEFMQIWYNVKDQSIYALARINKADQSYCNLKGKWTNLTNGRSKRAAAFMHWFNCSTHFSEGFYQDITVHPALQAVGYTGINALNWYYGCGEDINLTTEAKFIMNNNMIDFFNNLLVNKTLVATLIKLYGLDKLIFLESLEDEDFKKEIIAALRICRKNHYEIKDIKLWHDYTKMLFEMKKDLHNAHYVCPDNLRKAHDQLLTKYNAFKLKNAEKERRERAIKDLQEFIAHMQAFLNLQFKDENIIIRPLRSPMEYIEEGTAMHHCVASYYNRYNSLIMSARDHEDNRIATIEVSLHDYKIVQIRGLQNKTTKFDKEIAILITKNMKQIRKANKIQQKLTAALKKAA